MNKTLKALDFNMRIPSWIEYLDKIIFDVFGDYRNNMAEFNIRQTAVFVLQACAYDPKFYGYDPFYFSTVALIYSINCFFNSYEQTSHTG